MNKLHYFLIIVLLLTMGMTSIVHSQTVTITETFDSSTGEGRYEVTVEGTMVYAFAVGNDTAEDTMTDRPDWGTDPVLKADWNYYLFLFDLPIDLLFQTVFGENVNKAVAYWDKGFQNIFNPVAINPMGPSETDDRFTWTGLTPGSKFIAVTDTELGYLLGTVPLVSAAKSDEVIIDFGSNGIWVYQNNTSWTRLHPGSAESMVTGDMNNNGMDEVIIDFGPGKGIWIRYDNASWSKLHNTSPDSMVTGDMNNNDMDEVIIDFGPGTGIWIRYDNASWSKLHNTSPESMVTSDMNNNGMDEVIIDFGPGSGIWIRYDNASWKQLHRSSPDSMVTGDMNGNGQDDVIIDFGARTGVWVRYDNASWAKLHNQNPASMTAGSMDGI